jgi:hypothetical protein
VYQSAEPIVASASAPGSSRGNTTSGRASGESQGDQQIHLEIGTSPEDTVALSNRSPDLVDLLAPKPRNRSSNADVLQFSKVP